MRRWLAGLVLMVWLVSGCAPAVAPAPGAQPPAETASRPQASPTEAQATATAAPSPTPQPSPTPTVELLQGEKCLPGSWQLAQALRFFQDSFAANGNPAQLVGVEGDLLYTFQPDGQVHVLYDQLAVSMQTQQAAGSLPARSILSGQAQARYQLEGADQLVLSDFGAESVDFIVEIDGEELAHSPLPAWFSFAAALEGMAGGEPLAEKEVNTVQIGFQCEENSLSLTAREGAPPMQFTRLLP